MSVAGYRQLATAVLTKEVLLVLRYPINFVGRIVVYIVMFGIILFGGMAVAGPAFSNSLEGIIVGYFMWMMASTLYSDLAMEVRAEAEWGTLERHFITPYGFGTVLFVKALAKLAISMVLGATLLGVMMLLSGERLWIDVVTILTVLVFSLATIAGFGFAIGGLTVLYKQLGSWLGLFQFGFIALIAAPVAGYEWSVYLPLAMGSELLQQAMTRGVRVWEFPAADIAILVGTGIGYLVIGAFAFKIAQTRARKLGVLGHY